MPCDGLSLHGVELRTIASKAEVSGWTAYCLKTNNPGMFRPRPIPELFNVDLAKKWLSSCIKFHGRSCDVSVSVPGLILIDCETRQLCSGPQRPPYVALSYVWAKSVPGDFKTPADSTVDAQAQLPPEDNLSQVVKDSISVTRQRGYRYLWIDKYCINQRDAAGKDERHGLPGVGGHRRAPLTVDIGDFTITHVPTEPWAVTMTTKWAERAWTFQEELFSRRRLYFSQGQVSFICHEMLCCEALGRVELAKDARDMEIYSLASLRASNLDKIIYMAQSMAQSMAIKNAPSSLDEDDRLKGLQYLIHLYSTRQLTYDSDALRAFAGVRRVYEEGEFPIYNIQGLPVTLSIDDGLNCSLRNLVPSLCWYHYGPDKLRRRTDFPSWTWLAGLAQSIFPRNKTSLLNLR